MIVGLGGKANGLPRETGFVITAASEVMAILALASSRYLTCAPAWETSSLASHRKERSCAPRIWRRPQP